jgi:hypothetical protein
MKTKICTKCDKRKPLSAFWKSSRSKDGKYSRCKECKYEATRLWCSKNLDHLSQYMAKWRAVRMKDPKFAEKVKRRQREYMRVYMRMYYRRKKLGNSRSVEQHKAFVGIAQLM